MAVAQSSWSKALSLVNLNLPCSLLICSFISVVFTCAWVQYMTQGVMACFITAFHPGKNLHGEALMATDSFGTLRQILGNLYRVYQQNYSATHMSSSSGKKLPMDVCTKKHDVCQSRV